jgi:outer membrane protein assembly factor BamB
MGKLFRVGPFRRWKATLALTLAGLLLLSLALVPAEAKTPQGWPVQGADARRTSRTSAPGPVTPLVRWTYDLAGTRAQDNASPVVGPDGTIYVPSETHFYALNPDGTLKWRKDEVSGNSWGMRSAPALSPDGGTVYVLTHWLAADTSVRALNAESGAVLWTYALGRAVSYSSFAVGEDGAIYVGTWGVVGGAGPAMFAINSGGSLRWRYDSPSNCSIEAPPAVDAGGNVYFGHNCEGLVALGPTGTLRWRDPRVGADYDWPTPTIGPEGTVYADPYAFNPDGTLKWQRTDLPAPNALHGAALSPDGSTLYRAARGKIYGLNTATGATRWMSTVAAETERFGGSPALSGNGILFVMDNDEGGGNSSVYAVLASDGTLLWRHELSSHAAYWGPQSPALGGDGTLYVTSSGDYPQPPGRVYAFEHRPADILPPSSLTATSASQTQINLSWIDNSSNETGFTLERKTGQGGTYVEIATLAANVTAYFDGGLTTGTTYYYRARAYSSTNTSAYSNEAGATPVAPPPPPPPPPPLPPPPPSPRPRQVCLVPRVVGRPLPAAKKAIRRAKCSVGRVRHARSARRRGRVIKQSPRPGARRVRGARVNLTVSRGRR